jgi:electron transport complex protein RnfD
LSELYNVSTAPHTRSKTTTFTIMQDVAIALIPASIFGVYNFGIKALLMILVCIGFSVLTEYVYEKFMKKPITIGDFSAFVTGLLLALNMPVTAPLWMGALGSVFAILFVKMLFGGLGQNFMNPALAARCFLLISFAGQMSNYQINAVSSESTGFLYYLKNGAIAIDGVTSATPLGIIKDGGSVDLLQMLIGNIGGTIGETSALAILIGAIYLLAKKIISFRIPITYLASFSVFVLIFGGKGFDLNYLLTHLLGGGLMLGAFFMATDYVTSPITIKGQLVFGVSLGLLTGIFRIFGASTEGVSYAIIFCNMLVPLIEKITLPMAFGKGGKIRG